MNDGEHIERVETLVASGNILPAPPPAQPDPLRGFLSPSGKARYWRWLAALTVGDPVEVMHQPSAGQFLDVQIEPGVVSHSKDGAVTVTNRGYSRRTGIHKVGNGNQSMLFPPGHPVVEDARMCQAIAAQRVRAILTIQRFTGLAALTRAVDILDDLLYGKDPTWPPPL